MLPGSGDAGWSVPGRLSAVANQVGLNFGGAGEAVGVVHVFYEEWEEERGHEGLSSHSWMSRFLGPTVLGSGGSPAMRVPANLQVKTHHQAERVCLYLFISWGYF